MHTPRSAPGAAALAACLVALTAPPVAAEPRAAASRRPATQSATVAQPAPSVANLVDPAFRAAVLDVVRQPTLTATASDPPFAAHPQVYDWLTEHPDRASVAWRRMGVPCVEITQSADGKFQWAEEGSALAWQPVGRFQHGRVWYATGKVKPGPLLPTVPVRAVAVLHAPRQADDLDEAAELRPTVSVYLLTDSRVANTVLKAVGPAAPRMAEEGAEQLLLFFGGPARHIYKHPDQFDKLLAPAR